MQTADPSISVEYTKNCLLANLKNTTTAHYYLLKKKKLLLQESFSDFSEQHFGRRRDHYKVIPAAR